MEKVSFQPLIEHLKENAANLNQMLNSLRTTDPRFNCDSIPAWFKNVIEPVFIAVHNYNPLRGPAVFDILFRDMLKVLLPGPAETSHDIKLNCRCLLLLNPPITAAEPRRLLETLITGLSRLNRYSDAAAEKWISLMQQILPLAKSMEDVLAAGRVAAWRCGMAHLRIIMPCPSTLDDKIREVIFPGENCHPLALKRRWNFGEATEPVAAGGFSGSGGEFSCPPRLKLHGDQVFASDGLRSFAIFADRFGRILHASDGAFLLKRAPEQTTNPKIAALLARYPDLTSWVYHDSTLFITCSSSHAIFIFGAIDG